MRDAELLREYLPEIAAHAERSCAAWAPVLVSYLERSLDAAAGRGEAAQRRTQERSTMIRTGIRQAVGALPVESWGVAGAVQRRIEIKGPERYGLRRIPDLETIRHVLREMVDERKSRVSVLKPSPERGE